MKVLMVMVCVVLAVYGIPIEYGELLQIQHFPIVKPEPYTRPKYEFEYGVKDVNTGDIKQQKEVRDGDVVKGEYSLMEPDGTIRQVRYQADKHTGFRAIVTKSGQAVPAKPVVHIPDYLLPNKFF